jgi:hypothetical protein
VFVNQFFVFTVRSNTTCRTLHIQLSSAVCFDHFAHHQVDFTTTYIEKKIPRWRPVRSGSKYRHWLIKFMICHITELSSHKYQYEENKLLNNTTFKEYPHIKTGMITSWSKLLYENGYLSALEEKDLYCNISDILCTSFIHSFFMFIFIFYLYLKLL